MNTEISSYQYLFPCISCTGPTFTRYNMIYVYCWYIKDITWCSPAGSTNLMIGQPSMIFLTTSELYGRTARNRHKPLQWKPKKLLQVEYSRILKLVPIASISYFTHFSLIRFIKYSLWYTHYLYFNYRLHWFVRSIFQENTYMQILRRTMKSMISDLARHTACWLVDNAEVQVGTVIHRNY